MFDFDELNVLKTKIAAVKNTDPQQLKKDKGYYIDEVTDFFVLAYVYGVNEAAGQLGADIMPDLDDLKEALEKPIAGKTYKDRLDEYFEGGTDYDIDRVLDTDTERIYNTGLFDGAKKAGAKFKTWNTMLDNRVRDTHYYLEGVKLPIDDWFYSFMGGKTLRPGQWGIAEEDISCRCYLTFSKD